MGFDEAVELENTIITAGIPALKGHTVNWSKYVAMNFWLNWQNILWCELQNLIRNESEHGYVPVTFSMPTYSQAYLELISFLDQAAERFQCNSMQSTVMPHANM